MNSLYCTADKISMETGGGAATVNELEALRSVSDVELVIEGDSIPCRFQQPESPFLHDYFALEQIADKHFDIAHFYSGTFTLTVRHLKNKGTKISYMVPAHDRRLSIEEFLKLGLHYPFAHIKDDYLFSIFTEGHRLADIVLSQSHRGAEILKAMGCKRVEVVPGGIVWPKKVKPIPNRFDVAYLGVIGPDKGLVYLIQAWGMLNYSDSRLILAGAGTETLDGLIRNFTDKGDFILLGRVEDVADVYNNCSVYIQPSVTEGFGLEIPEAMSYGRPVITTEGAGAKDCITEGVDGFIVPIRDPRAIADRIDFLKKNPDKMVAMGQRAREKAKNYTWDKIRAKYINVWEELCA
ncbi:glycosyltransferase family 4 protein [Patescibacteria group bacterium]|nr:glycosyltransferase family 4 protein [Patescibacteria group bacterium]